MHVLGREWGRKHIYPETQKYSYDERFQRQEEGTNKKGVLPL